MKVYHIFMVGFWGFISNLYYGCEIIFSALARTCASVDRVAAWRQYYHQVELRGGNK